MNQASQALSPRQTEIIEAAGIILTESGVGGLTIKNLAKAMQFSEPAIYRHFENKEAIIVGMLQFLAEVTNDRYYLALGGLKDPEERFKVLFKNQFQLFKQHPHFVVAVFSDGLMQESEQINQAILRIMEIKRNYLIPIIKDGQKQLQFTNTVPADALAHIVMGAIRLHMFKWRATHFELDIEKEGKKLVTHLLQLIKK
jgi:TetR/AcrR family transcriptional regulator, fatty acid metabolism regulator protein